MVGKVRFHGLTYRPMLRQAYKRLFIGREEYASLHNEREPPAEYLDALEAAYNIDNNGPGYSGTIARGLRLILPMLTEHARSLGSRAP